MKAYHSYWSLIAMAGALAWVILDNAFTVTDALYVFPAVITAMTCAFALMNAISVKLGTMSEKTYQYINLSHVVTIFLAWTAIVLLTLVLHRPW